MPADPHPRPIVVVGAAEHNLKSVSLAIPARSLTVFTGVSGSGKSSLAQDTICREGQRRFLESLSPYARQFLGNLERPRVERIDGLSPTVSIDQRTVGRSPRSTVGTITEIHDHLRLLYARLGTPHCHRCGRGIEPQSAARIADRILAELAGHPLILCAPLIRGRKGSFRKLLGELGAAGHHRLRIDGRTVRMDREEPPPLARFQAHSIEIVHDRLEVRPGDRTRLTESVEKCLELSGGLLNVVLPREGSAAGSDAGTEPDEERLFSARFACPACGESIPELEPRLFSFNSPHGACPECRGVGEREDDSDPMVREGIVFKAPRVPCAACGGARLGPPARAVRFRGRGIAELAALPASALLEWFDGVELEGNERAIGLPIVRETVTRLRFLCEVGLGYLALDRGASTLAGGEAQRIRLASQVGSGLEGVLFVLDEPSIGLHPRDQDRLLGTLRSLRDRGNTVLVVEHDRATIEAADHLVDIGPGAGKEGGEVVASGTAADLMRCERSITGRYLAGERRIPIPETRRAPGGAWLEVRGARHHNLRGLDVRIPLGLFVVVTGVSGSGKSSLLHGVLRPAVLQHLRRAKSPRGRWSSVAGAERLEDLVEIDQSPIGRSPRSNPATYTKLFQLIRELFASLPSARERGYGPERFSFNRDGGRCPECRGAGVITIEMQFLAPVEILCEECGGRRYNRETLEVTCRGKSISQILSLTVLEAREFFRDYPRMERILAMLEEVGLGYIEIGQPSTLLSGGEAQRVKLAAELHRAERGRTLYVLDEPTTGLHWEDVRRLLAALDELVRRGNTVLVIEHSPEVMGAADWIIDLGPEGGEAGGRIVAEGPPEAIAASPLSHTGQAIRELTERNGKSKGNRQAKPPGRRRIPAPLVPTRGGHAEDGDRLIVRGARQHNLKDVTVSLPRGSLTVITGLSGSGKSSLAFDTIFNEGQRRYLESLSTYARRFLGRMEGAPVDSIEGLSPAIAIDQEAGARSPRSTLATVTEIHDHLRLLFARTGRPHCPDCDEPLRWTTPGRLASEAVRAHPGERGYLLVPLSPSEAGLAGTAAERRSARAFLGREGFTRLLVDGAEARLDEDGDAPERPAAVVTTGAAGKDGGPSGGGVFLVIDRVILNEEARSRIAGSLELAFTRGKGLAALRAGEASPEIHTLDPSCPRCGFRFFEELSPRMFSFNSQVGACPRCLGLGREPRVVPSLLVRDPERPLLDGALPPPVNGWLRGQGKRERAALEAMARARAIPLDQPFAALTEAQRAAVLQGDGRERPRTVPPSHPGAAPPGEGLWPGLVHLLEEWHRSVRSSLKPGFLDEVLRPRTCSLCQGGRLRREFLKVRIGGTAGGVGGGGGGGGSGPGLGIAEVGRLSVDEAVEFFGSLPLAPREAKIAEGVLLEIRSRLRFLQEVGLGYLTLERPSSTLSGGEAQRIRLASQIGNRLAGVLYVLDEPTVGLHPRDTARLLGSLRELRDLGNTVILVEHDREVMEAADHLIDLGPGAGILGGEVVASGSIEEIRRSPRSLTGRYLSGDLRVAPSRPVRQPSRGADGRLRAVRLLGVRHHNLDLEQVEFPLGLFTAVSGVSGSGKSSLVMEVLARAIRAALDRPFSPGSSPRSSPGSSSAAKGKRGDPRRERRRGRPRSDGTSPRRRSSPAAGDPSSPRSPRLRGAEGLEEVRRLVLVDQSPLGRSPRSNPATATGLWEEIRELFARLPESRVRGYGPERFSFNLPGGRCEKCRGEGAIRVEMHFLSDVWIPCEECRGMRFNRQTLEVKFKSLHAGDVLRLEVDRAREIFSEIPRPRGILDVLHEVGLGYLRLGQSATTLSGGEAQRVKLAAELVSRPGGGQFYILDEPTTGLHFEDVRRLLEILHRLVDGGGTGENTLVVIEHHLEVIRSADWVIDLGPEAGPGGGRVVAEGPPGDVARVPESHTGRFLARTLGS